MKRWFTFGHCYQCQYVFPIKLIVCRFVYALYSGTMIATISITRVEYEFAIKCWPILYTRSYRFSSSHSLVFLALSFSLKFSLAWIQANKLLPSENLLKNSTYNDKKDDIYKQYLSPTRMQVLILVTHLRRMFSTYVNDVRSYLDIKNVFSSRWVILCVCVLNR